MKRLSISWSKEPSAEIFKNQLCAILDAYEGAIRENIEPSDLYLSVSPLAHDLLHKLCAAQSPFIPSMIQTFCGLTIIVNEQQTDYCLELKQKEKDPRVLKTEWEREYKEAVKEFYKNIRKGNNGTNNKFK